MKNSEFTQLHLHTYFSILDGVPSPEEYVEKAKSLGMKSCAITDHGTMSGVLRFNNACLEAGIKPIIGCEFYINYNRDKKEKGSKNYHLILIAKNKTGYKNLLKINYDAMENGFYYRGRADENFIFKNSEGLICMTACLGSVFSKLILDNKIANVKNKLRQYKKVFGEDFYIELQFNETKEQLIVTRTLNRLAKELDITTVVTGDCHYIEKGDEEVQSIQLMINTKKTMSDKNVFRFSARSLYFHIPEDYMNFNRDLEYGLRLKDLVQSMKNTQEIVNKCDFVIEKSESKFPRFINQDGLEVNADVLLKKKLKVGAKKLFPNGLSQEYKERLRKEFSVVSEKGFSDYFLIIEDIIKFCEKKDIAVGAGRGSAAGSLISFILGITKIDPLKYDLLFERFLNKDRKDPPDIDLDFESKRKSEIEIYLRNKYGNERVAHIITFSTFRLKGAIRDIARVLEKEKDPEFKTLIKKIPSEPEEDLKEVSLYEQIKKIDSITKVEKEYVRDNKHMFNTAGKLIGHIRQKGSHAGGTAITPGPIYNYVPVDKIKGEIVTGFMEGNDYRELSDMGVLKVDILGLKTVDIIKNTLDIIRASGENLDIHSINMEDPKLFEAINKYQNIGIFQFENTAIDAFLKKAEPFCFNDIVTINGLYRPALINANEHEKYIYRRQKVLEWENDNNEEYQGNGSLLTEIVKPTFGTIVFQEQFMIILQRLGNFTLEEADKARKTFKMIQNRKQSNEKKKEDPEGLKVINKFTEGVKKNTKMNIKEIQSLIDRLAEFAGYAFNKCLVGDTLLYKACCNQYSGMTESIETFYNRMNNYDNNSSIRKKYRQNGYPKILSFDKKTKRIIPNKIINIFQNGIKKVYRITLENNSFIEGTSNHKILTQNGYKEIKNLKVNDNICIIGEYEKNICNTNKQTWKKTYRNIKGCGFPEGINNPAYIDGRCEILEKTKLEVIKRANGKCEVCKNDLGKRPEFHHKKENQYSEVKYQNKDNILYLCNSCHKKEQYKLGRKKQWQKGRPIEYSKIVLIKYCGKKMTYDIEMEGNHNYIANGIIVHNSHAVSYSVISMQTLFLREYYPKAFYSALLNWSDNSLKQKGYKKENEMKKYIYYIKSRGFEFLPVDINKSKIEFLPEGDKIRIPLTFIPGIGDSLAKTIYDNAPYKNFYSFCIKEINFKSNKTSILRLIDIGAFDSVNSNRIALHKFYEEWALVKSKHKKKSLDKIKNIIKKIWFKYKDEGDFTNKEKIDIEKEICKFNLFEVDPEIMRKIEVLRKNKKIATLSERTKTKRYCFKIESIKVIKDKNKNEMAFYNIEDWKGKVGEAIAFASIYKQIGIVEEGKYYAVKGYKDENDKIIIGEKGNYGIIRKPFISVELLKNI